MSDWRSLVSKAALAAAVLVLAGCGGQQAQRKVEMARLSQLLTGEFDNLAQLRTPEGAQLPALRVAIVPIYAPLLGRDVFYLQEMAADDVRRVTLQRVLSLEVTPDGRLLEGLYSLNEPGRWRDGHERPDVFKSMLPQDLKLAEGCDVTWRQDGKRFTGANEPARCRVNRRGSGEAVRQESHVELDDDGIAFSDTQIDANGVREPAAPTWFRFRRRAN